MIGSSRIVLCHVEEARGLLPEQSIKRLSMGVMNVPTKMLLQLRKAVTLRNVQVIRMFIFSNVPVLDSGSFVMTSIKFTLQLIVNGANGHLEIALCLVEMA